MPKIKPFDMKLLDLLFEMEGGYVLNFSNATFSRFFPGELEIDIDDPLFTADGTSKAKRFRSFLALADTPTCVRALKAVWAHRQALLLHKGRDDPIANAEGRFLTLIQDLESGTSGNGVAGDPFAAVRKVSIDQATKLKQDLLSIHKLAPQARGYAFETFLQQLFEAFIIETIALERMKSSVNQVITDNRLHVSTLCKPMQDFAECSASLARSPSVLMDSSPSQ